MNAGKILALIRRASPPLGASVAGSAKAKSILGIQYRTLTTSYMRLHLTHKPPSAALAGSRTLSLICDKVFHGLSQRAPK